MAEIKPITAKAGSEAANEALAIKPALDPNSALLAINVFDGTRQPIKNETQLLLTVTDGAQNQLYRDNFNGPSVSAYQDKPECSPGT